MTTNDEPTTSRTRAETLPWRLIVLVAATFVALSVGFVAVAAQSASLDRTQQEAEAARVDAREAWAEEEAAAKEKAAREEEAARKEAARERAERAEAAREEAAREKAAREKAAREEAARQQAAREKAAREQAAREEAAREKAARQEAARERAEQAAREREAAAMHEISGEVAVSDINGALVTQVGGYPGQPLTSLGRRQLDKLGSLLDSLEAGRTYPCPAGAGGGYSDLTAGAQVAVMDGSGDLLATTSLTGGRVTTHGCVFSYRVSVPDADFYQVEVTHRGALKFSRADLIASDWRVFGKV